MVCVRVHECTCLWAHVWAYVWLYKSVNVGAGAGRQGLSSRPTLSHMLIMIIKLQT